MGGATPLAFHLTGVAILLATVLVVDLRLLGLWRAYPVRRLALQLLPFSAGSFLLIVPSGFAMFLARAQELIADPVFALKMGLVMAAGVNAAVFHAGAFRTSEKWNVGVMPPPAARIAAALSLALWSFVVACGLTIAAKG